MLQINSHRCHQQPRKKRRGKQETHQALILPRHNTSQLERDTAFSKTWVKQLKIKSIYLENANFFCIINMLHVKSS